jgi:hypothetical protein
MFKGYLGLGFMEINATFNNISVISWQSLYSSEDFIKVCFISKVVMVKVIVLKENISFS